ncbi:MAG: HipA domain-containing protein [Bifidobacterium tibiigranuli]|nr:HipA domain-containing protein [Bifidobacterium tibiigranuli]MCI1649736.1 HipA domain-containing protein [Bifidobacterium tibiigranuli]MCI2185422.1 HipA domain-containing protein [Bifidobacterium tibiigranuli]
MEERPVGTFLEASDGAISFEYDKAAPAVPISLSLPRGGGWPRRSPSLLLDNLLPDGENARRAMMRASGAEGMDAFSLLDGADSSGGLVFSLGEDYPASFGPILPASADEIGTRIANMRESPDSWWDHDSRIRYSLAGNQPKLSLARVGGVWTWPNAGNPSTHILKPSVTATADAELIEAADMRLAGLAGLSVPQAGVAEFSGERTYITERFDRKRLADGRVSRIHMEDLAQSLGIGPEDKYKVSAGQVLRLLHTADESDALSYSWLKRLALNTSIGNADAHAKNYSVILAASGLSMSPMYDVLTTTYWDWVDPSLPMKIGGARYAQQVTASHWAKLARANGLDEEHVVAVARETAGAVLAHADEAYRDLPADVHDKLMERLKDANRHINPIVPQGTDAEASASATAI